MNYVIVPYHEIVSAGHDTATKTTDQWLQNTEEIIKKLAAISNTAYNDRIFWLLDDMVKVKVKVEKFMAGIESDTASKIEVIEQRNGGLLKNIFSLAPYLSSGPFCLITTDLIFNVNEFLEFLSYAKLQDGIEGTLAITNSISEHGPLSVALDEEDLIFKFNKYRAGYSWCLNGLFYFRPAVCKVLKMALENNINQFSRFLSELIGSGYLLKAFPCSHIKRAN